MRLIYIFLKVKEYTYNKKIIKITKTSGNSLSKLFLIFSN